MFMVRLQRHVVDYRRQWSCGQRRRPGAVDRGRKPGSVRQGSVAIAGRGLPVAQANGCSYAATPITHTVNGAAGKGTVLGPDLQSCRWGH